MTKTAKDEGVSRIATALSNLRPEEVKQTTNLAAHLLACRQEGEASPSAVVMGQARGDFLHALSQNNFPNEHVALTELENGLYAVTVGTEDQGHKVIFSKS